VEDLYDGRGPEQILPLRLPHPCAQYQEKRPETLPPRCKGLERRLDQIGGGIPCHPHE
jgi:hypothetical protein